MAKVHEDHSPPTLAGPWNMMVLEEKCIFSAQHPLFGDLSSPTLHGTWYFNPVSSRLDGKMELNVQEIYWESAYQRK